MFLRNSGHKHVLGRADVPRQSQQPSPLKVRDHQLGLGLVSLILRARGLFDGQDRLVQRLVRQQVLGMGLNGGVHRKPDQPDDRQHNAREHRLVPLDLPLQNIHSRVGSRQDRFARQVSTDVPRQVRRRLVPACRVLLHGPRGDDLHVAPERRHDRAQAGGGLIADDTGRPGSGLPFRSCGCRPASTSKRMTPSAKTSARTSTSLPASCSGAM